MMMVEREVGGEDLVGIEVVEVGSVVVEEEGLAVEVVTAEALEATVAGMVEIVVGTVAVTIDLADGVADSGAGGPVVEMDMAATGEAIEEATAVAAEETGIAAAVVTGDRRGPWTRTRE